jgi:hypothetical protein
MSATRLQEEFKSTFLDDTDFSESVSYTVSGAAAKTINAVVFRKGIKQFGQRGDGQANSYQSIYDVEITISKNATDGIAAVTVNADKVSVPLNVGGTAVVWVVAGIVFQDLAIWKLGLRK